jgi:ribonuclease HI
MDGEVPDQIAGPEAPRRTLLVHVDGGARGNPGPAAIGVVVSDTDGGVLREVGETIGFATNNVAEYRALLRGIALALELGASEVELVNDSELVAKQLTGAYKVKHPAMKELHAEAAGALRAFDRWRIRTVPRAQNARADELVNEALDGSG